MEVSTTAIIDTIGDVGWEREVGLRCRYRDIGGERASDAMGLNLCLDSGHGAGAEPHLDLVTGYRPSF